MSKSDLFENALIDLIFNATPIANLADDAAASPLTNLYVSLHTGDPGEGGNQAANECAYTGYARVAVARNGTGWTVSGNSVSPAANIDFPEASAGSETATHFAVGTDPSGAGRVLYFGTISPTIAISAGVTPRLGTGTAITED
ncbi:phage tail fiber protein [Litorisediminicola beolgyonensis]|uniref:Uncharacterized protein n=1 Tax=Litorisediminicola beolgyonensis TaxID=1173614 RepID=A0ABW3ZIB2_9RHOB